MEAFIIRLLTAVAAIFAILFAPAPLAAQTEAPLLLRNVRILDLGGSDPALQTGQSILIDGGIIKAIGPMAALSAPPAARVVDGGDRIAMPGLVDMHVHLWDNAALGAYLAHGVTTIRNWLNQS